jgi:RNA polymerase sigma factor (sigma-70 family)
MSGFASTRWSLIQASRTGSESGRRALDDLCQRYRQPIIAYLRHRGLNPESAEDEAQSFFVHLIEQRLHCRADPQRGSFRAFMLTALRNHLSHRLRSDAAIRRGGDQKRAGSERLSELPDTAGGDPETAFERAWAQTIVQQARERLRDEAASQGKTELYERLSQFLIDSPERGDYAALGEELGLSKNAVAAAVKRLRRRHRELVKDEITDTVDNPAMLKQEHRRLAASLGQ